MNGVIVVDKPMEWTSHDVVGKLRGLLRERRIGHGGTLDPMATGVLPVFVGRATRAVSLCESADKEYIAGMRPGIVTDTQDITGTVLETRGESLNKDTLLAVNPEFTGEILQLPPMYSAVKVGGKKLYELARRGVELEREARPITIHALELLGEENGDFSLRVVCSKGTYIRTLVHDMGQRLSCGAALSSLRRTRAGRFTLEDAHTMEELIAAAEAGTLEELILPVDRLFADLPSVTVTEKQEGKIRTGAQFRLSCADGRYRVYGPKGDFLMVGICESGIMRGEKNFFEVQN